MKLSDRPGKFPLFLNVHVLFVYIGQGLCST